MKNKINTAADLVKAIQAKYKDDDGKPMTLEALGNLGGWSTNTVWRWRHNKAKPHKNHLRDLVYIYDHGPEKFKKLMGK